MRLAISYCKYKTRRKHYLFIEFANGCRLGNQMFFVAAGETLRKRYDLDVLYYTPVKRDFLKIDDWIFRKVDIIIHRCNFFHIIKEKDILSNIDEIKNILMNSHIVARGTFEDLNFIDRELARQLFAISPKIRKSIINMYGDLSDYVCVHVRRGDFVKLGISLPIDYYEMAMSYWDDNQKFIVVSDDIAWCEQNFKSNDRIVFAKKERSVYHDLFIPTLCQKGNIISCSTFTWWGAFLNENPNAVSIMPYPWWNYRTDKKLYLDNSIKIDIHNMRFI